LTPSAFPDNFFASWGEPAKAPQKTGGLAQLGERYNGIVEVIGSSPLSSIQKSLVFVGFLSL
jgi:hypothetical protein